MCLPGQGLGAAEKGGSDTGRNPTNRGRSGAKPRVLTDADAAALVVRSGPMFADAGDLASPSRGPMMLRDVVSPTYAPDLVESALDLLVDGDRKVWRLANRGAATLENVRGRIVARAEVGGSERDAVLGWATGSVPHHPHRVLDSERGQLLPSLDDAVARHVDAMAHRDAGGNVPMRDGCPLGVTVLASSTGHAADEAMSCRDSPLDARAAGGWGIPDVAADGRGFAWPRRFADEQCPKP